MSENFGNPVAACFADHDEHDTRAEFTHLLVDSAPNACPAAYTIGTLAECVAYQREHGLADTTRAILF